MAKVISVDKIESRIFQIRGKRVMLDMDLANLYGVSTKRLNEQVKRNTRRFPDDFMFQLKGNEVKFLRSQFATSSWGGRRYSPYVFTEQGVAMLSSVLNSEQAIQVNIQIMRAFVRVKRLALTYVSLKRTIEAMEKKIDIRFNIVFEAIKKLLDPAPVEKKRRIGFRQD